MIDVFKRWYKRNFANPQTVILALILIIGSVLVIVMSQHLMPILISIVIAYLFEGTVQKLGYIGVNRTISASLMTALFLTMILLLLFVLLPLLSAQISDLFRELPRMLSQGQHKLSQLPERYPDYISDQQIQDVLGMIRGEITSLGQQLVTLSLSSVVSVITFFVYLILLPLMLFFFLKDKQLILLWLSRFLPRDRELLMDVSARGTASPAAAWSWNSRTAASPVLYKDLVFINASVESESLIALDRQTGKEKWRGPLRSSLLKHWTLATRFSTGLGRLP